jgi:hypothetical protein
LDLVQLQPRVALGMRFKLRRESSKNCYLSKESEYRRKRRAQQEPACPHVLVALVHRQSGDREICDIENHAIEEREPKRHFAVWAGSRSSQMVSVREVKLTQRAREWTSYALHLLSQFYPLPSSQMPPRRMTVLCSPCQGHDFLKRPNVISLASGLGSRGLLATEASMPQVSG